MYNNPYMMGGNISPQLAQNRMEQLQNQYNAMFPQQNVMMQNQPQQTQFLKGRPVSSVEEARASMIDLDGTMFIFTDIANNKIYTKQVLLDGTAELKTYVLEEQKQPIVTQQKQSVEYVTKQNFDEIINDIKTSIENMKEDLGYADNEHD